MVQGMTCMVLSVRILGLVTVTGRLFQAALVRAVGLVLSSARRTRCGPQDLAVCPLGCNSVRVGAYRPEISLHSLANPTGCTTRLLGPSHPCRCLGHPRCCREQAAAATWQVCSFILPRRLSPSALGGQRCRAARSSRLGRAGPVPMQQPLPMQRRTSSQCSCGAAKGRDRTSPARLRRVPTRRRKSVLPSTIFSREKLAGSSNPASVSTESANPSERAAARLGLKTSPAKNR